MSNWSLAELVEELQRERQLARVEVEVDPHFEIAEITRRVGRCRGPALLFNRVTGQHVPVLTNLLGHERRICRAFGVDTLDMLVERILAPWRTEGAGGWFQRVKQSLAPQATANLLPKTVKTAPCQQIVRLGTDVALDELPALQTPGDSGRFVTAGGLITVDATSATEAISPCRLEVLDRNRLALYLAPTAAGRQQLDAWPGHDSRIPLAVVLGGHPVYRVLPHLPLLHPMDAWLQGAAIVGQPLELVRGRTQELRVPADAELVLEGYLDREVPARTGGTFAHSGSDYPAAVPEAPIVRVTAVTHRSNPIFPAVVADAQRDEDRVLAELGQRLLLAQLQLLQPEVIDLSLPQGLSPGAWVVVSIRKSYAQQAQKVAAALWGLAPLVHAKLLVIVDQHCDVHDVPTVLRRIGNNVHPARDTFFHPGPAHWLDHATAGQGSQMALDATDKLPGEHPGVWPRRAEAPAELREQIDQRWKQYGLGDWPAPDSY